MELVRNRSFTLSSGDIKQSRLFQGLVLAALPFNIYTYHDFQRVCLYKRSSIVALFWKLGPKVDFKSRHNYTFNISPDWEVEIFGKNPFFLLFVFSKISGVLSVKSKTVKEKVFHDDFLNQD